MLTLAAIATQMQHDCIKGALALFFIDVLTISLLANHREYECMTVEITAGSLFLSQFRCVQTTHLDRVT